MVASGRGTVYQQSEPALEFLEIAQGSASLCLIPP
jgi:hypothetical protein